MTRAYVRLMPLVFPVTQVVCFALAVSGSGAGALAALALASLALSFSVHVTIHECVHHGYRGGVLAELAMSLAMGMPLEGYRYHHMNHHEHENGFEDFSSTWRIGPRGPQPRSLWRYALVWPEQLAACSRAMRRAAACGQVPAAQTARVRRQKRLLAAAFLLMALASWRVALAYVVMVYAGWVLISVHNYGQHPPVTPGEPHSTSYRGALYNVLFCANGLHWEHHARPGVPWDRLAGDAAAPRIALPHLVAPLARRP